MVLHRLCGLKDAAPRMTLWAQLAVILAASIVLGLCAAADLRQVDPSASSHQDLGYDCDQKGGLCIHKKSSLPGIVEFEAVAPEITALKVRG